MMIMLVTVIVGRKRRGKKLKALMDLRNPRAIVCHNRN